MTEVTDKMVDAACVEWLNRYGIRDCVPSYELRADVRAAIDAALAARKPVDAGELVEELKGYVQSTCKCPLDKCADVIEELVEALTIISSIDDKLFWEDWEKVEEAVRIAKSSIAKAGIKP